VPLAIQAASQALCYPLVAMVASRGPGGPLNLAGLAQANIVMFFFGMFAISYVTTGMVFAKTREGYQKFQSVTLLTGVTASRFRPCCAPRSWRTCFSAKSSVCRRTSNDRPASLFWPASRCSFFFL